MSMSIIDRNKYPSTTYTGYYSWQHNIKSVHYGPGSVATALPELVEELGMSRVMIMTSRTVCNKTPAVNKIISILNNISPTLHGCTFSEVEQHSPEGGIRKALDVFRTNNCDGIISVGGGSVIDASKTMLYFYQLDKEKEWKDAGGGGDNRNRPLPHTPFQIAVPTTLGGAEYQMGAGYLSSGGAKLAVSSPELPPGGIILDAEMTLNTPERLWLSTGIKSLDHAVENLYRPQCTPPVKVLCYNAITEFFKYLPLTKENPQSVEIRQKLMLASWMSLWPMKLRKYVALGISHSLGHKIGGRYNIPHGITSCLTLAPCVALQAKVASQEDKEYVAAALKHINEPTTGTVEGDIKKFSSKIEELVKSLGLYSGLGEWGVPRTDLRELAALALGGDDDENMEHVVEMLEGMY